MKLIKNLRNCVHCKYYYEICGDKIIKYFYMSTCKDWVYRNWTGGEKR